MVSQNTKQGEATVSDDTTISPEIVVKTVTKTDNKNPFKGRVVGSCLVELLPKYTKHVYPLIQEGTGVEDHDNLHYIQLGASITNRGLPAERRAFVNLEEEKEFILPFLGVDYDSRTYTENIKNYFGDFMLKTSAERPLTLEVGFYFDEIDNKLIPINLKDYVTFRLLIVSREVCISKNDLMKSPNIHFWLRSDVSESIEKFKSKSAKDQAIKVRFALESDPERAKTVLLAGIGVVVKDKDIELQLFDFAERQPEKLVEIYNDVDLEYKALINYLISTETFHRPANSTVILYDGQAIGGTIEEVVLYLKRAENAQTLAYLRSLLTN